MTSVLRTRASALNTPKLKACIYSCISVANEQGHDLPSSSCPSSQPSSFCPSYLFFLSCPFSSWFGWGIELRRLFTSMEIFGSMWSFSGKMSGRSRPHFLIATYMHTNIPQEPNATQNTCNNNLTLTSVWALAYTGWEIINPRAPNSEKVDTVSRHYCSQLRSHPSTRTIKGIMFKEHVLGGIKLRRLATIRSLRVWGKGTRFKVCWNKS